MMKTVLHIEQTRGVADHGWLKSKHSFSFASYHNPERMGFGALRVINDDRVAPSAGFATHPHRDMEIVSIPLTGSLQHKDSEGHEAIIKQGEVQLMSAGSGVFHSEYNASNVSDVQFLQIWVLPEKLGIKPRYDQKKFDQSLRQNQWQTIVSPMDKNDSGVKINQQSWFSLLDLDENQEIEYFLKSKQNGVYFLVLAGQLNIADESLRDKDALGISEGQNIILKTGGDSAKLLAIEIPIVSA